MSERLLLQIKGMKITFLLPLLGYFVFIPFCVKFLNMNVEDADEQYVTIQNIVYQFIPILALVWIYAFQKEYVEGEGREILILGRQISLYTFIYFLLNIPLIWLALKIVCVPEEHFMDMFMELLIAVFMISGFAFFMNFAAGSIALSMLIVILYIWLSNVNLENMLTTVDTAQTSQWSTCFFYTILKDGGLGGTYAVNYLVIGALFWLLGIFKARRL